MRSTSRNVSDNSNVVDAAALQNEMAKKYGIATNSRKVKRRPRPTELSDQPQQCRSCGSAMSQCEFCESCGYIANTRQEEMESQRQQQSLAFRRGLMGVVNTSSTVSKSIETVKPLEWYLLEKSILKKDNPDSCCPICMECFRSTEEVLLSCGHIFHRTCLRSFENFIQNADLSCPICRTKNYQKKVTNLGTISHQKVCCVKIQAVWRGCLARKDYRFLLRSHYKSGQTTINKGLQRKFFTQEVTSLAAKLDDNIASRVTTVNTMLTSMERTLDDNRQLDRLFDEMLRNREQNRRELGLPNMHEEEEDRSNGGRGGSQQPRRDYLSDILTPRSSLAQHNVIHPPVLPLVSDTISSPLRLFCKSEFCMEASTTWSQVFDQALSRGDSDCAICMSSVSVEMSNLHDIDPVKLPSNVKFSVILSCSHVFHHKCIGNFERYSRTEGMFTCPICRSRYSKRIL